MRLHKLSFTGPGREDAELAFAPGLNVICGASETGKSFVAEAIDFMLGSATELRDIGERVGYDRVHAIWSFPGEGELRELIRPAAGGDYVLKPADDSRQPISLKAKAHLSNTNTLSAFILSRLGLFPKKIRRNAKNETNTFSIRDLSRLVLVQDSDIDKRKSPFLSGQKLSETADYSALRLLLTGVDDSALTVDTEASRIANQRVEGKLELLDEMIEQLQTEIDAIAAGTEQDAREQLERIETTLERRRQALTSSREELSVVEEARRSAYGEATKRRRRAAEIDELSARFALLDEHYENDIARLEAIRETGTYFSFLEQQPCPLCGAAPGNHAVVEACEGDTDRIVAAAQIELEKIAGLRSDLETTAKDLAIERAGLVADFNAFKTEYTRYDALLSGELSRNSISLQAAYQEAIEARAGARARVRSFERLAELQEQRKALTVEEADAEKQERASSKISKTVLDDLSQIVLAILKAWDFPDADRVHFDEKDRDFVIDGKPRGARGRGLRAITHAAATIGVLEYCQKMKLPHPGFVVMDSPLLAYFEPDGDEDDLRGTDLKLRFYRYLIEQHADSQIIIIENTAPPEELADRMALTAFTKNPHHGRYGLFPHVGFRRRAVPARPVS